MDVSNFDTLFEVYRTFSQNHEYINSMATAMLTFTAADATSQLMIDKKVDPKKLWYTFRIAPLYGVLNEWLVESGEAVGEVDILDEPHIKAALGPNLWGNGVTALINFNNVIGERNGYKLTDLVKEYASKDVLSKIVKNIPKEKYEETVFYNITAINFAQWANYAFIDTEFRSAVSLGIGYVWVTALSALSLTGRRELVHGKRTDQTPFLHREINIPNQIKLFSD